MRPVKSPSIPLVTRAHLRGEGTAARRAWRKTYVRRLVAADAACALVAAGLTARLAPPPGSPGWLPGLVLLVPLLWVAVVSLARGHDPRILWNGPEEFRRVLLAGAALAAAVGTVGSALPAGLPRTLLVVTLPLVCLLTLVQRYGQRAWLYRQRDHGHRLQTTLLVGPRDDVAALHDQLAREPRHGYRVVGCCLTAPDRRTFDGLPVLGGVDDVVRVVDFYEVDTVAVLPAPELEGGALRRLGWDLETTCAELLLAPAVTDLAGPRIHVRPAWGLPLLQVDRPELQGARRLVKAAFDRGVALCALVLLLPVLLAAAVTVRMTSPGPVLVRHVRGGRGGRLFGMLAFRTVLVDENPAAGGTHPFLTAAPRTTPVGRFLRRHCIDQLPELVNVLAGHVSLVGARPLTPPELQRHGDDTRRRLLGKPGLTGLWQLSGRPDLSWEDQLRMELVYVENWSLTADLVVLGKAVRAALRRDEH